jgi:outer membrane protein TolC
MKGARWLRGMVLVLIGAASSSFAAGETLTFQKALDLATGHSPNVGIAMADQMKAHSSYQEARRAYVPAVALGSGLGASWGFPLTLEGSAPSIFNINAQSALINPAQQQFVKAARSAWNASLASAEDQRAQTLLDTAVTFAQLNAAEAKLKALQEQADQAQKVRYITQQRIGEGVDSNLELKRASLNSARVHLRIAETQGSVDVLKQHLAQLTAMPSSAIEIDGDSMPAIPDVSQDDDAVSRALANSSAVKASDEQARSKEQQAKGEHRALYPSIDFAAQYARLAKYNNYEEFYKKFEPNNATVGVAIRFPFLNSTQRAHAEAADADALRSRAEAQATRNLVASNTLKLQRAVGQVAAVRDVARLEWELAQSDLDAVAAKLQTGDANLRDQENARMAVTDKYASYIDAAFEYDKARLQLMSATGELTAWAAQGK